MLLCVRHGSFRSLPVPTSLSIALAVSSVAIRATLWQSARYRHKTILLPARFLTFAVAAEQHGKELAAPFAVTAATLFLKVIGPM